MLNSEFKIKRSKFDMVQAVFICVAAWNFNAALVWKHKICFHATQNRQMLSETPLLRSEITQFFFFYFMVWVHIQSFWFYRNIMA